MAGLFQPYNRNSKSSEGPGGMCMGLALSKMLIELHGGKIWVQSEEGEGSIFSFTVPVLKSDNDREPL
jgi:signal transduction histidine kinase